MSDTIQWRCKSLRPLVDRFGLRFPVPQLSSSVVYHF